MNGKRFFIDQTPLETLLAAGMIWLDERTYVGAASDGGEVQFGQVGEERSINSYLVEHPNPTTW